MRQCSQVDGIKSAQKQAEEEARTEPETRKGREDGTEILQGQRNGLRRF